MRLSVDAATYFPALQLIGKLPQIDIDQIGRALVYRHRITGREGAGAADLGLVIAGEESLARSDNRGFEILLEKCGSVRLASGRLTGGAPGLAPPQPRPSASLPKRSEESRVGQECVR